jgi:hypothetical protein
MGQERPVRDRLRVSQVDHHVYSQYTSCLTDLYLRVHPTPYSPNRKSFILNICRVNPYHLSWLPHYRYEVNDAGLEGPGSGRHGWPPSRSLAGMVYVFGCAPDTYVLLPLKLAYFQHGLFLLADGTHICFSEWRGTQCTIKSTYTYRTIREDISSISRSQSNLSK